MIKKIYKLLNIDTSKFKKVYLFMLIVILFSGILSIFVRYPMSWYDEQVHYARVISYSHNLNPKGETYISEGEQEFIQRSMGTIAKSLDQKTPNILSLDWKHDFKTLNKSKKLVKTRDAIPASVYTPIVYLPYILATWVANILRLDIISSFIFLRLIGFLSVFILLILAFRKLPFGKATLLMIASIPTVILSFTAISADTLTYGLIFLFVAHMLNLYQKIALSIKIKRVEFVKLLIISVLLVLAKMPAFAVLALYLPMIYIGIKDKKLSKFQIIFLFTSLLFCAFLTIVWYLSIKDINGNVTYYGNTLIDQGKQLKFILSHPLRTLRVFIENILDFPYFDFQLGYSDFQRGMQVPVIISIFSLFSILNSFKIQDSEQPLIDKKERIIYNSFSRLIFIGVSLLIFLIFYLQVTEVGSEKISGVQGRYFLSFLILLVPFSNGKSFLSIKQSKYVLYASVIPAIYYILLMFYQLRN